MAQSEDNRRAIARRERRDAGDQSARVANIIMKMAAAAASKLKVDDDVRAAIARARAVSSPSARRRAERELAGVLRRTELDKLERHLADVLAGVQEEPKYMRLAEDWRARMLADDAVAETFPGGADATLAKLIHQARRERDTAKPPGAGRALFRHITAVLRTERERAAAAAEAAEAAYAAGDDDDD